MGILTILGSFSKKKKKKISYSAVAYVVFREMSPVNDWWRCSRKKYICILIHWLLTTLIGNNYPVRQWMTFSIHFGTSLGGQHGSVPCLTTLFMPCMTASRLLYTQCSTDSILCLLFVLVCRQSAAPVSAHAVQCCWEAHSVWLFLWMWNMDYTNEMYRQMAASL